MIAPYQPSLLERQFGSNLYVCVLVQGPNDEGTPCYAYFGLFADRLAELTRIAAAGRPFNPQDIGAIVLARSTGEPSPEIREFMRIRFSFSDDSVVLETSRG